MKNKSELNIFKCEVYPKTPLRNIKQFFKNIKYGYQRATRGFSDYDLWNLDYFYKRLIIDSLEAFKKYNIGYPDGYTQEEWNANIEKIIEKLKDSESFGKESENKYTKAFDEMIESLHSERKENPDGSIVDSYDDRTPKQKELTRLYAEEERKIVERKQQSLEEGMAMLAKSLPDLWW